MAVRADASTGSGAGAHPGPRLRVCRTDLHVVDGELPHPKLPLILGHEIVGTVVATGGAVGSLRWGSAWGAVAGRPAALAVTAAQGRENLCDNPGFTGYTLDGGYAEYAVADQRYSFPLPPAYDDPRPRRSFAPG